jgi:DNA repair protein RadC
MTQASIPVYRLEMVRERSVHYASATCQLSSDAAAVLHALLDRSDRERIYVIALNVRNKIVGVHEAASGGS